MNMTCSVLLFNIQLKDDCPLHFSTKPGHISKCGRSFEFLQVIRSHASQNGAIDYTARWYGKVISPRGEKVQAQHETNLKFKVWEWRTAALYCLISPTVESAGKQIAIFAAGKVREHLIFPFGPSKPLS